MAKKFEFKSNDLELDIAGNKFYVDTTNPDLLDKVLEFSEGAIAKAEKMEKEEDYVKELRETIAFCLGAIDNILGKGSSDTIFEGRSVGLFDALDVVNYIVDMVKAGNVDKFDKYSPNRVTRRAKK